MKNILITLTTLLLSLAVFSCANDSRQQEIQNQANEAAEEVGDAISGGVDGAKDALGDAGNEVEDLCESVKKI